MLVVMAWELMPLQRSELRAGWPQGGRVRVGSPGAARQRKLDSVSRSQTGINAVLLALPAWNDRKCRDLVVENAYKNQ